MKIHGICFAIGNYRKEIQGEERINGDSEGTKLEARGKELNKMFKNHVSSIFFLSFLVSSFLITY